MDSNDINGATVRHFNVFGVLLDDCDYHDNQALCLMLNDPIIALTDLAHIAQRLQLAQEQRQFGFHDICSAGQWEQDPSDPGASLPRGSLLPSVIEAEYQV